MPARTLVMGILNVTPDSFSDGGRYNDADAAVARAEQMLAEGADVIDIGGESTRPGATALPAQEEIARVLPVVGRVAALDVRVSVDTRKAAVACAALDAGAWMVNDVSGGSHDPGMAAVMASSGCEVVLMHMRGDPATMDSRAVYDDVRSEVHAELSARVEAAVQAGVARGSIWVDPGLGFAKTPAQSLALLRDAATFRDLGRVVVGPSRKRFVGHVTGAAVDDRLAGTAAAVAWCAVQGVDMVRVHDVREMRHVVDMIGAIGGGPASRHDGPPS